MLRIVVLRDFFCYKFVCFCTGHFVMVPLNLTSSTLFATFVLGVFSINICMRYIYIYLTGNV